jgi:hypothetical protein
MEAYKYKQKRIEMEVQHSHKQKSKTGGRKREAYPVFPSGFATRFT